MEDVLKGRTGCQGVPETSEMVFQDKLLRLVISSLQTTISCKLLLKTQTEFTTVNTLRILVRQNKALWLFIRLVSCLVTL